MKTFNKIAKFTIYIMEIEKSTELINRNTILVLCLKNRTIGNILKIGLDLIQNKRTYFFIIHKNKNFKRSSSTFLNFEKKILDYKNMILLH